jgi:hypothetical protein
VQFSWFGSSFNSVGTPAKEAFKRGCRIFPVESVYILRGERALVTSTPRVVTTVGKGNLVLAASALCKASGEAFCVHQSIHARFTFCLR